MAEIFESQREQQYYETHRILYELSYREYEQATFELPGRLRDKAYALLQLYVVTIGVLPPLLTSILRASKHGDCAWGAWVSFGAGVILLVTAAYFIRDAIQLRSYDIMDSTAIRKTASEKFIHPLDLVKALENQAAIVRKKNADWAEELSKNIRRSYISYGNALLSLILCYLLTLQV